MRGQADPMIYPEDGQATDQGDRPAGDLRPPVHAVGQDSEDGDQCPSEFRQPTFLILLLRALSAWHT
jgi:hypothetical protein